MEEQNVTETETNNSNQTDIELESDTHEPTNGLEERTNSEEEIPEAHNQTTDREIKMEDKDDTAEVDENIDNEETGTKHTRADRRGPRTDTDEGDIQPTSSTEQKQEPKIRKETQEQKE